MIRKQTSFIDSGFGTRNQVGCRAASRFGSRLEQLVQEFSLFPEDSEDDFLENINKLFEEAGSKFGTDHAEGFINASMRAYRTERVLAIQEDDIEHSVASPVSMSMSFYLKNQRRGRFYEIMPVFNEAGRIYKIMHMTVKYMGKMPADPEKR